jgi:hypothetical protein
MIMKRHVSIIFATAGVMALLASSPAAAAPVDFSAQAAASGLTADQSADLQKRVDEVLANIPGGKQVSATEIKYDGLDVTIDPFYSEGSTRQTNITCDDDWFCINVRGQIFRFWACQTWTLSNWWGNAPFNNNQSYGTVAKAFAQDGTTEVFAHMAKGSGEIGVFSWWYFKPC